MSSSSDPTINNETIQRKNSNNNNNNNSSSTSRRVVAVATDTAISKIQAQQQLLLTNEAVERKRIDANLESYRQQYYSSHMEIEDRPTAETYNQLKNPLSSLSTFVKRSVGRQRFWSTTDHDADNDDGRNQSQHHASSSCCINFIYDSVWPGLGLLGESYMLFSIGILRPIWNIVFPTCFVTYTTCSVSLIESISYSVILGVICGMVCIGYAANHIGRRTGSIITASFMCLGSWLMTLLSYSASYYRNYPVVINAIFSFFCCSLFIFGIGVGGEYPLSASSASEKAMEQLNQRIIMKQQQQQVNNNTYNEHLNTTIPSNSEKQQQLLQSSNNNNSNNNSGQSVQLVFSMQGMGILLNSIIMTVLIALLAKPTNAAYYVGNEYDSSTLLFIWQVTYTFGACILSSVLYTRYMYLKESKIWADDQNKIQQEHDKIQHGIQQELLCSKQRYLQQQLQRQGRQYSNKLINSIKQQNEQQQQHNDRQDPTNYMPPDPPGITKRTSSDLKNSTMSSKDEVVVGEETTTKIIPKSDDSVSTLSFPTCLEHNNDIETRNKNPPPTNIEIMNDNKSSPKNPSSIHPNDQMKVEHPQMLSLAFQGQQQHLNNNSDTSDNNPPIVVSHCNVSEKDNLSNLKNSNTCVDETQTTASSSIRLLIRHYGMRLIGVSLSWMLWDVAFYGNKLFQSTFILALTGSDTTLLVFALAATINSGVALLGYFGAAAIIDSPRIGRRKLQQWGFLLTGTLFVAVGFFFDRCSPNILVLMYLGSSFFGQLGPNATTFLIPAEIFPTEMRTVCHGIAAASGKLGALIASVLFNYIKYEPNMFLLSGYASFAAFVITYGTIPETMGLDLYENDKKWRLAVSGRDKDYVGDANDPRFLSWYERNFDAIHQYLREIYSRYFDKYGGSPSTSATPYNRFTDPAHII